MHKFLILYIHNEENLLFSWDNLPLLGKNIYLFFVYQKSNIYNFSVCFFNCYPDNEGARVYLTSNIAS